MPIDLHDDALRGYLLGELSGPEAAALEERYFTEPDLQERLRGLEDDLVDDYAAGRLGPAARAAFERGYLVSAEHRLRVEVARALRPAAAGARSPRPWILRRPARAALALAAVALAALGLVRWLRVPGAPMLASQEHPAAPAPAGFAPRPAPARGPVVAAFTLSPLRLRSGGAPAPLRPGGADEVLLRLSGEEPPPAGPLRFALRTAGGEAVASGAAAAAPAGASRGVVAEVALPAERLRPEDYVLTLSGPGGDLASYTFRVAR